MNTEESVVAQPSVFGEAKESGMEFGDDFGFRPSSKVNPESNDEYAVTPEKL